MNYSDFSCISVGDSILDVEKVDDICEYYIEKFKTPISYGIMESMAKEGRGCCSIHYLTDGLLKIQYGAVNDKGEAVVTSIDYYPDYVMETCDGEVLDYRLNPLDLPK